MAAWSEHRGVVPYQIEFLHADFLILIVTRTNEIVPASDGRSDEVDLDLFLLFGIGTPPLPDLTQLDGKILRVVQQIILTHLFKNLPHIIGEVSFYRRGIGFHDPAGVNRAPVDRHKTIPEAEKMVR